MATRAPETAVLRDRLAELADLIPALNDDRQRLYDERGLLVVELRGRGLSRGALATLTGTSVEMVKQILSTYSPNGG